MIVAIDGRGMAGPQRGVARYAGSLLTALRAAHPEHDYRVVGPGSPGAGRRDAVRMATTGRPTLDGLAGGADVVWAPAPRPLAVRPTTGLVLTVHDRSWEQRPRDFTAYERVWHRVARPRRLAARAHRVLFDTEAVRGEVTARWGLARERTAVARPGVDGLAAPGSLPASVRAPYLLWVGALEPRKAPEVLAAAYRRARAEGLRATLVVVGAGREAGALAGPGVVALGRTDDATLAALLAGAQAVVAPSRAEGYGLVPLEALALGTPSVVSDLPVFRETLGPAALRVAVGDVPALASALLRLEREPALREALVAAAPDLPTWADAAEVLHEALTETARR